nr:hypothetical protein [Sinorhizobium medicae]
MSAGWLVVLQSISSVRQPHRSKNGLQECVDLARGSAFPETGKPVLRSDIGICNANGLQTRMCDELEIGDHADTEAAFDCLPNTFAATNFEKRFDGDARSLSSRFERPTGGRAGFAQDQRLTLSSLTLISSRTYHG